MTGGSFGAVGVGGLGESVKQLEICSKYQHLSCGCRKRHWARNVLRMNHSEGNKQAE